MPDEYLKFYATKVFYYSVHYADALNLYGIQFEYFFCELCIHCTRAASASIFEQKFFNPSNLPSVMLNCTILKIPPKPKYN